MNDIINIINNDNVIDLKISTQDLGKSDNYLRIDLDSQNLDYKY